MPALTFLPHFNQVIVHQADQDSMFKVFLLSAFGCKTFRKSCDYKCRLFQNRIVYLPTFNFLSAQSKSLYTKHHH